MSSPRTVRIPRSKATSGEPVDAAAGAGASPGPATPKSDVRWNQAANERAHRLLLLYLGTLAALYVAFLVLDREAPGGTSATAATGMLYFSVIAAFLAAGGIWVALGPVPRRLEVTPRAVVVVEALGTRREFPPLEEIHPSLVRRYPQSFLSSRAVDTVEITDSSGRRRTYQLEHGIVPLRDASDVP